MLTFRSATSEVSGPGCQSCLAPSGPKPYLPQQGGISPSDQPSRPIHENIVHVTPTDSDGVKSCQVPSPHSVSRTTALPDKRSRGGGSKNGISRFTSCHCVRPSALHPAQE